jgi:hypothetical protein
MAKKIIYGVVICAWFLITSIEEALVMMALFGLYELMDINENTKTK